jgi:hypothetical protein
MQHLSSLCNTNFGLSQPSQKYNLVISFNRTYDQPPLNFFHSESPWIQKPKVVNTQVISKLTFFFPRSEANVHFHPLRTTLLPSEFVLAVLIRAHYCSAYYSSAANCSVLNPYVQPVSWSSTPQSRGVTHLFHLLSLDSIKHFKDVSSTLSI